MLLKTQLSEKKKQKKKNRINHKEIMKKYISFLKENLELTEKEYDYPINCECETSNFMAFQISIKHK